MLRGGRTIANVSAYEVLGDQVKLVQSDGFALYYPLEQVDLAATERRWIEPPQPQRSPLRVVTPPEQRSEELHQPPLSLAENIRAFKAEHPEFDGGVLTEVGIAGGGGFDAGLAYGGGPTDAAAQDGEAAANEQAWKSLGYAVQARQQTAIEAVLQAESAYRSALAGRSESSVRGARQRLQEAKSRLLDADAEFERLRSEARAAGAETTVPAEAALSPMERLFYAELGEP